MNRYINAGNLLTKIKAYRPYQYLGEDALSYAIKMVELEPSADVRENVKGEWLHKKTTDDYHVTGQCSNCHERRRIDNFCPNCGADMRGEQDE